MNLKDKNQKPVTSEAPETPNLTEIDLNSGKPINVLYNNSEVEAEVLHSDFIGDKISVAGAQYEPHEVILEKTDDRNPLDLKGVEI